MSADKGDFTCSPANLMFSHMAGGVAGGMQLVFLSREPPDHHQIVLATGRPAELPANTNNPQCGPIG
jgi:hypothetical protein